MEQKCENCQNEIDIEYEKWNCEEHHEKLYKLCFDCFLNAQLPCTICNRQQEKASSQQQQKQEQIQTTLAYVEKQIENINILPQQEEQQAKIQQQQIQHLQSQPKQEIQQKDEILQKIQLKQEVKIQDSQKLSFLSMNPIFEKNQTFLQWATINSTGEITLKQIEIESPEMVQQQQVWSAPWYAAHCQIEQAKNHEFVVTGGLEIDEQNCYYSTNSCYKITIKSDIHGVFSFCYDDFESMNVPRHCHKCYYLDHKLVVVGGLTNTKPQLQCEMFDLRPPSQWKLIANLNIQRINCSGFVYQNQYLYIFGGISQPFQESLSFERIDMSNPVKWELIDMKLPSTIGKLSGTTCIFDKQNSNIVHIFGGCDSVDTSNQIYDIDLLTNSIKENKTKLFQPRSNANGGALNAIINDEQATCYIIFGGNVGDCIYFELLDLNSFHKLYQIEELN